MAGNFTTRQERLRLVAKIDAAEGPASLRLSAKPLRRGRIMVARDPQPVAPGLHLVQAGDVACVHALAGKIVVERIAQGQHDARAKCRHQPLQPVQRRCRVVGRKKHAAPGKGRAFLQMQVGHHQEAGVGLEQGAGRVGDENDASHGDIARRSWRNRGKALIASLK